MSRSPLGPVVIVMPTYNEADNLAGIAGAILENLPGATLLVVDDRSPDGTGRLADELAAANPRIRVRHRAAKQGLGRAYLDGFDPVITDATVFRVIQRGDYGMARRYVVRPVLSVFDYEWASESAFEGTSSGDGESS